ncbi:tRNA 2'-phosphotransferase 1 [Drosophila persimilis]|uniref:tRNA 2'-phosphotransferase 1 n=1 Tax=Drosophila persimilis TaxID=7234 RepID=UPI000F07B762|nr:tRNA 2'-phosphotransferase 1 [Drosophila persimilis]
MPPKQESNVQLSKKLTWLLRHGAVKEGIAIQADGFVNISDIQSHPRYVVFSLQKLQEIVADDAKQRYILRWNEDAKFHEIRANQGHSLAAVQGEACLERISNAKQVPLAVHGTYYRCWEAIKAQGLGRLRRNYVHFAVSDVGETLSGFRSDSQLLVYLDVAKVLADNLPLFRSSNNVILCAGVDGFIDKTYFSRAVDRRTGQQLTY